MSDPNLRRPEHRQTERRRLPPQSVAPRSVAALGCALAVLSCGSDGGELSYQEDIAPLFDDRCTACHFSGGPVPLDLVVPFGPGGLLDQDNTWAEVYGSTPERIVQPGAPDESFLLDKLELPSQLPAGEGGDPMPLYTGPLRADDIEEVRQWIADGAAPDRFRPLFNDLRRRADDSPYRVFGIAGSLSSKCVVCHYPGSPDPPDLTDPAALINVPASYRTDLTLVVPGDPDASYLVTKLELTQANGEFGAPMPYRWEPLTADEVDRVRRWILAGAPE